ncbi:chloramphenicol O-acetyltransferase type A [Pedobacter caeni]|uniref:Chloramphenicol O-acetyltransferase type A n=2 Tax=Pedobacter caeni TaxID=288992 RepID=A0A1M5B3R4_9SPHI|nr:chloramphenicol O-acetyltransferase type A [Pedobacter caeni]
MQFVQMKNMNKSIIDIKTWKRKDHYYFFKEFEQPFFGVNTALNCTDAYHYCKANHIPFFLFYLHKSLKAIQQIKEFKYRIERDLVFEYQQISGSVTVLRDDETFGFAYFEYYEDFSLFMKQTKIAINAVKMEKGLTMRPELKNIIHYTVLPGIQFSSMQHAYSTSGQDYIPKIAFGKFNFREEEVLLPLSIHVHHALCDGLHLAQYIDCYQQEMDIKK